MDKLGVILLPFCISLIATVVYSSTAGEFKILHSPSSLQFIGSNITLESLLKEIISASLGLSVDESTQWLGLSVVNPFNTPEAVVELYVDGLPSLGSQKALKTFPLTVDEFEPDIFESVKQRINRQYGTDGNILVDVKLYDTNQLTTKHFKNVFGECQVPNVSKEEILVHLKQHVEVDYLFLNELEVLKLITNQVDTGVVFPDNQVDFYNLRFRSIHALTDYHGSYSAQTKEAHKLLDAAVRQLCKAFVKAYDGSVLVTTIIIDVAHSSRAIRSPQLRTESEGTPPPGGEDGGGAGFGGEGGSGGGGPSRSSDENEKNTALPPILGPESDIDPDFNVMFNIILWLSLAYFFSFISIVYVMMDMDPGRDSIIYRMTTMKGKKDN